KCRCVCRDNHKFLEIDRVISMYTAIDNIHHWHRERARRGAPDIAIKRDIPGRSRGFGNCQRDAKDSVGAQPTFVWCAVESNQRFVYLGLGLAVYAAKRIEDLAVNGIYGPTHALAPISRLVTVAQLNCLMCAGGRARRYGSPASRTVLQGHLDLDGRIAAAIKNFAADNIRNGGHRRGCCFLCGGFSGLTGLLSCSPYPLFFSPKNGGATIYTACDILSTSVSPAK